MLEDIFGFLVDFLNFGVGFPYRHQQDVLGMDAIRHFILLDILLILSLQIGVRNLSVLPKLGQVDKAVTNNALLWNLVLASVLFVGSLDLCNVGSDFGFQIFRLDERVIQFHLLVLIFEFVLEFGRANANAVGNELSYFFEDHRLTDDIFKGSYRHLGACLNLSSVLISAYESIAIIYTRENAPNAIGKFLIGNANTETFGFVFNGLPGDKLLRNLTRVVPLEHIGNLAAT